MPDSFSLAIIYAEVSDESRTNLLHRSIFKAKELVTSVKTIHLTYINYAHFHMTANIVVLTFNRLNAVLLSPRAHLKAIYRESHSRYYTTIRYSIRN